MLSIKGIFLMPLNESFLTSSGENKKKSITYSLLSSLFAIMIMIIMTVSVSDVSVSVSVSVTVTVK